MDMMASQITSLIIVYSTVYSGADQRNIKAPHHWPLCQGTGEFPAQMASNAENVSIWWRHHVLRRLAYPSRHMDLWQMCGRHPSEISLILIQRCKWSTRIKSISLRMSITFTGCKLTISWWRHQMETSSALLAICAGNSPVSGEFPAQRPVTRSFDVFFDLRPNKRLSKQSRGWWFETLSSPLWRHRNVYQYARAVSDRGAAFDACIGFMDGTARPIARPTENQRVTFSVMVINLNLHVVLHEPRIFYPSGHWPETVTNAHVSAHFR